jgi:uncharacterized membrane protein YciS (DUF1049 family)
MNCINTVKPQLKVPGTKSWAFNYVVLNGMFFSNALLPVMWLVEILIFAVNCDFYLIKYKIFFSYFLNSHYKVYYNLHQTASQQTIIHICQSRSSAHYCQIMHLPFLHHSEA